MRKVRRLDGYPAMALRRRETGFGLQAAMLAALLCWSGAMALAQESTRVNVGFASAKPTDLIDIPVTFSGAEGAQAGNLVARINFPKALLAYENVERALAAELADAEVKAAISEDAADKAQGVIELTISGKTVIKPGIVAYMKFRVAKDAPKGEVPLKLLNAAAKAADGSPVQLAQGDDGNVTVFAMDEEIPVVGCFFFTH